MAVKNDEMEQVFKSAPLMENEKLTDESQKTSNTRELLKKAREAANQKFAMTINKKETSEDVTNKANSSKVVLNGAESPAFHGQLIKTKLKRVTEPVRVKKSINKTSEQNQNIKQPTSASKSLLDFYKKVRAEYEDFREIEAVRLEKRLEKFSDFPKGASQSFEEYERRIVPWQQDSTTKSCYLCLNEFTLINRRHHCRLCGRIICAATECMESIPIKLESCLIKELKSCTKCHKLLFKKSHSNKHSSIEEKMNSLFKKMKNLKEMLLETIPRFNSYLLEESVTEARPLKEWRQDAWTLRDTLILYSVHFRATVQELTELAENEALEKPIFRVFANNLKRAGNEFLQKHMFTLQIVDLTTNDADDNKQETTEISPSVEDGLKVKMKKLVPSLLNELFKVSSSSESGLLEFYNDEGDLIPLTDSQVIKEALSNKETILKEQLQQLERQQVSVKDGNESINRAIEDIKIELDRLKGLKI